MPKHVTWVWRGALLAALCSTLAIGPTPHLAGAQATAGVAPGALTLTATFNSIGVELLFAGDANANASAGLEFRPSGAAEWRQGLPLWRTNDGSATPGPAFYGSALLLDPGIAYEVRITVADPDGVAGNAVLTGTATTRAETIPPADALIPTHYVRTTGSDTNDGVTEDTAWRTLDRALSAAPPGAIVQVGPGFYQAPNSKTVRTQPITLLAQYPAVDDSRTVINEGLHAVVEPAAVSSPAGSGEPNAGVWQQVTPAGATYTVWKWAGSPITNATQLGYAASHAAPPTRVANWKKDNSGLATPTGWAEKLYTNRTYTYGFYAAGADLYLRLPIDRDPNTLYITAGRDEALALNGPDIRISGLEIRQFGSGVYFDARAVRGVVDHCLLSGNRYQVYSHGLQGPPSAYGGDHVIQFNLLQDSSLWTDDPVGTPGIPWDFIKGRIANADGSGYATARIGEQSEGDGVGARGGAQRVVVRFNTIDGTFNGVSPGFNTGYDRYAGQDMDVHDNLLRHIADDPLEPDGQDLNFRAWRNRVEHTSTFLSIAPAKYGPLYVFRNEVWQTGNDGVTPDGRGERSVGAVAFKYSGTSSPQARVYVLHNTFWTDRGPDTGGPGTTRTHGGAQFGSGGTAHEAFYLRNNVFRMTGYAFTAPAGPGEWDEDYYYFSTSDPTRGLTVRQPYAKDLGPYRVNTGQGAHTNLVGGLHTLPALMAPEVGDLSLPFGSPLIDAGVPVPNLSDRPGIDFAGAAPDLGARET